MLGDPVAAACTGTIETDYCDVSATNAGRDLLTHTVIDIHRQLSHTRVFVVRLAQIPYAL